MQHPGHPLRCLALLAVIGLGLPETAAAQQGQAPLTQAEAAQIRADQELVATALERAAERLDRFLVAARARDAAPPVRAAFDPPWWVYALGGWNLALTVLLLVLLARGRSTRPAPAASAAAVPEATPPATAPAASDSSRLKNEIGVGQDELHDFGAADDLYLLAEDDDAPALLR